MSHTKIGFIVYGVHKDGLKDPMGQPFIDEELIIPLDGFIQQDPDFPYDDFYTGMLDIYTLEGQSWAIPAGCP